MWTENEKNEYLNKIEQLLYKEADLVLSAYEAVLDEGVSNYPIILVHDKPVAMGIKLLEAEHTEAHHLSISTLEEMYVRQLIAAEYIDEFRELYKSRADTYCVFGFSGLEGQWIFVPKVQTISKTLS